ncbi:unnamed protein product [Adineta steineri]|uniref:NAD(P)(+)--arginine ADP-ribosyltransferase n=1 Tax=Adineta steineri TaxID=433720 RepID=A0A814L0N8_9BILA|nr:unnamed protein product [Adineta steineri]
MASAFFVHLNEALRAQNQNDLEPWFAYLKLFITALEKLPSTEKTIWRGVSGDVGSIFDDGDIHTWWSVNSCSMNMNVVEVYLGNTGTIFIIDTVRGKNISTFSAFPQEEEIVLMPGTRLRATSQFLHFIERFFLVYLKEDISQSYICQLIKREYQQNSRIERMLDPSKSFSVKESYINLAIVETKQQQKKEKKLLDMTLSSEIIDTYEDIYGTKTQIEVNDIFEKCNDQIKKILVFGRAGIGKTTFCRYVAYQWATGVIWRQYELVIVIHLRNLTDNRYPELSSGNKYSLIDLVKIEYCCENISDNDIERFNEQLDNNQVLWLLDGYDEIVQNIPTHLEHLLEQLLETSHHILTSRPYLNTLSYKVEMEIIGFTDDNIQKYVTRFFAQHTNKTDDVLVQSKNLLKFLKYNPRIWGIFHIPVNLELICSFWSNTDGSITKTLTMTAIYDKMVEWLCRRHLEKQNKSILEMTKNNVYKQCDKELAFLETLAFLGMQENAIILPPKLLKETKNETGYSSDDYTQLFNVGILKSYDDRLIGTCIEAEKDHYFLHLSFQEHFTARYLVNALNDETDKKTKAINFIKVHRYNKRFELVFTFVSGLLNDNSTEQSINLFWKTLLEEPLDIIGIKHLQLIVYCIDEGGCNVSLSHYCEFLNTVINWIRYSISENHHDRRNLLLVSLQKSLTLLNQTEILDMFVELCKSEDSVISDSAYLFFSKLPVINSRKDLIDLHLTALRKGDEQVMCNACEALSNFDENTITNEIINGLVESAYSESNFNARKGAYEALCKISETATTDEMFQRFGAALNDLGDWIKPRIDNILDQMSEKATISQKITKLISVLDNRSHRFRNKVTEAAHKLSQTATINEIIDRLTYGLETAPDYIRQNICQSLNEMGGKVATNEVINALGDRILKDSNAEVRRMACQALGKMGKKAATKEMIDKLVSTLSDKDDVIKCSVNRLLSDIGETSGTNRIIHRLGDALVDTDSGVRRHACQALGGMGEKASTNETIDRLGNALEDTNAEVRRHAVEALGKMGKKAATDKLIIKLVSMLSDKDDMVTRSVCNLLGQIGEKAETNEIVDRLGNALEDTNAVVREHACEALGKIGEKAATNKIINKLVSALDDSNNWVNSWAYFALGNMGEKAAKNEVIKRLATAISNKEDQTRRRACETLDKIGVKEDTNDLIRVLLDASYEDDLRMRYEVIQKFRFGFPLSKEFASDMGMPS